MSHRDHALDALRGFAMMLGILLHSALSYMFYPLPTWPIRDTSRYIAFDLFVYATHSFRMQTFMLLAGFFGALLYRRVGMAQFARHRLLRIGVPLVVGALLVQPQMQAISIYQETVEQRVTHRIAELAPKFREYLFPFDPTSTLGPAEVVARHFLSLDFLRWSSPMHLWFLYYLCFLYALVLGLRAVMPEKVKAAAKRVLGSVWGMPILVLSTVPVLFTMKTWQVDSSSSWMPVLRILVYYFFFFSLGWLIYGAPELLRRLSAPWRRNLMLALVSLPVAAQLTAVGLPLELTGSGDRIPSFLPWLKLVAILAQSAFTWLAVFGLIGAFQELLSERRAWVRYLADASYWCYLVSPVPILLLQIALAPIAIPGPLKFLLVAGGSLAVLLISYEGLVRYTLVGNVLHGKRVRNGRGAYLVIAQDMRGNSSQLPR